MAKARAAVVGAAGYGGGELLRWLSVHPDVEIAHAVSGSAAGKPVAGAFAGLSKRVPLLFESEEHAGDLSDCDVAFLARDNGTAMHMAEALLTNGVRVIDLSADFRLKDPALYPQWYGFSHTAESLLQRAVYGLPELFREEIRGAHLVANPGCYVTAATLALAPLVANRRIQLDSIVVDGKSGLSGAGRSRFGLDYHFAEANESVSAYKIAGTHRHTPEIEQSLSGLAGSSVRLSFTPHLVPMTRGILATCTARLAQPASDDLLRDEFRQFYADAPFTAVLDGLPSSKQASGSNLCLLGLAVDNRTDRVTVISAIDNLGKGMVGQAIQNMNLMLGLDETAGLTMPGMWP
jgi:N-acetyl-gamma-glutamyl-phosphate reductase